VETSKHKVVEILGMLIEHGTDVSAQNKGGSTPLHLASAQHFIVVSPQRYAEVVRLLLEYGSDMIVQDKARRTPFDLASRGHGDVARVLLGHGAERVTRACINKHRDIVIKSSYCQPMTTMELDQKL
jgi:ankyrin repeat protein